MPKGIITEYTSIYCILIHIDKTAYCIARRSAAETGHMYFLKVDDTFSGSDISMDMFTDVMNSDKSSVCYSDKFPQIHQSIFMSVVGIRSAEMEFIRNN